MINLLSFSKGRVEAQIEELRKLPPLERLGQPEDIACRVNNTPLGWQRPSSRFQWASPFGRVPLNSSYNVSEQAAYSGSSPFLIKFPTSGTRSIDIDFLA
jgi:hypothetical protein